MTLESSLDCKEIQQSMPKEISPGCSLEGLMLKLKLQYFGHLMWRVYSLENSLMLGRAGAGEKGTTEDKMIGWHHRLDGLESEWTPGVGDGQGGLACCDSWGRKESDTIEQLNWLFGRKVMTNLDSILKSRDITLPTKFRLVKAMVFPVIMYGYESRTVKKAEHWRTDAFKLWYWRRLLWVP